MRAIPMLRRRHFRALFILAVLTCALGVGASSQTPATAAAPKPDRFILSAVDDSGAPVTDLTTRELAIQVGEHSARIASLTRYQAAPIRIIIVLDESSSMAENWRAALGILSELLHSITPNSSVSLIGVNSEKPELIETPGAIARYLNNRSHRGTGGWTRLWDDMHLALVALPNPRPTDVIFVVSDGVDTASKVPFSTLRQELRTAGVRVSGAILVDMLAPTASTRIVSPQLAELMAETGGWNLTTAPFLRQHEVGGRFAKPRVEAPNIPGFLSTLYDFYYVDLEPSATPRTAPLAVHVVGARGNNERVLLSAPGKLPATIP
jgi:Mg-chelatase subunit ChlD